MWGARSDLRERNAQAAGGVEHAVVVAREGHVLTMAAQELDRGEMERIEGTKRRGEGLERAREDRRLKLDEGKPRDQFVRRISMRRGELERIQPDPDLRKAHAGL